MRKFMINVNGRSYEVEVEEVGGVESAPKAAPAVQATAPAPQVAPVAAPVAQPVAPAPATKPVAAQAPAPAQSTGATGSVSVNAPMPGNILDVKAKVGESIQKGQVVVILEAMKMENEIMAPQDGKITSINTSKGSIVNSGDLLFSME